MSDFTVVPWSRYGKKRLYVKTADGREIGYLDLLTGSKKKILERVPQHYIANYLGITPVSLSRIRNQILHN